LENTSVSELASQVLESCLAGRPWPALDPLLEKATSDNPELASAASRALFTTVVERLGDLFEPQLCDVYARLFSEVITCVRPKLVTAEFLSRYSRVRQPRRFEGGDPRKVFVLSRITLGADVAVTSVVLDAMKRRFPSSAIYLVGPKKNWELFAADPQIRHFPFTYGRTGSVRERLATVPAVDEDDSIVVDPDSRLSQLGLLPLCSEDRYYFFESRGYGGEGTESLSTLTGQWVAETFGVSDAKAYIAPLPVYQRPEVTVSFGVGENPEKRIDDPFEQDLIGSLVGRGHAVLVDKGAGADETRRVENVLRIFPMVEAWEGDYAPFASMISRSQLYIGYDSAGQHVAAACGVSLISVFAGYVSDRMFQRWYPTGPGPVHVIKVTDRNPQRVLRSVIDTIDSLRGEA
jgi:ADP-heptose:LPS heptosyltransferase